MFLSLFELDIHHPSVRQALRKCTDMHRDLMSAFDAVQRDEAPRQAIKLQYRVIERRDCVSVLMMSDVPPNAQALAKRGFRMDARSPKDLSPLRDALKANMRLRFELVASPCKKVKSGGRLSRRVFLKTVEEREAWLVRQGEKYGFVPDEIAQDAKSVDVCGAKTDMAIHYTAVRYSGTLTITDPALFWTCFCEGIGPGKAYGLGMLTLARI